MKALLKISIFLLLVSLHSGFAEVNGFGMFNVYFSIDEALGYRDVRDDLSEVYAVGCRWVTHYFRSENSREAGGERVWFGLDEWLRANPDQAERLQTWKNDYGASLGWKLFFYSTYLLEAYQQTKGGLKVLVGEMYGLFPSDTDDAELKTFVNAIREFEAQHCPGTIGGWYVVEEPNGSKKRYRPERYTAVVDTIYATESEKERSLLPIYVDISPYQEQSQVVPFVAKADVIMISPDAYIWARVPPTYIEEAQYESIPHAVRSMREHAKAAGNPNAKIEVVLQAYDWNQTGALQPTHINMHQQVSYALKPGWVNRGEYGKDPRWEPPPDGIWFWWWHDCKSKSKKPNRPIVEINRWDAGTEGNWAEAIQTELPHREKAVLIRGTERWTGTVHIIGDVIVDKGATLIVEPGTTVKFATLDHFRGGEDTERCELIIRGKLIAKGTPRQKITLTSDSTNPKLVVKPREPRKWDWYGIRTEGQAVSLEIEGCEIRHALRDLK
jgi:hypothetical protein